MKFKKQQEILENSVKFSKITRNFERFQEIVGKFQKKKFFKNLKTRKLINQHSEGA